jgi:serine/threonine protein kinase
MYEADDSVSLVLDLVLGETLFEYMIRKKKLGEQKAAAITAQLLAAVSKLTSHKIMHRDFKPENVMIDDHFHAYVIDFGLARRYDGAQEYEMCGTPGYIAPEILAGDVYDGEKVDVFSVGALLYLMVSGTEPFGART